MKKILLLMTYCLLFTTYASAKVDNCIECHKQLDENLKKPVSDFTEDIHKRSGLSCVSCHGGNADTDDFSEAKSEKYGFVGKPSPSKVPGFCGKCHSNTEYMKKYNPSLPVDQEEKYFTSQHGMLLKKGDEKVATCESCHTPHKILPATDPRSSVFKKNIPYTCKKCHSAGKLMSNYKIPSDQFDSYVKSVHGAAVLEKNDFAAPTCNTCHGNHGAIPPQVGSIKFVCGMCHQNNLNLFLESPMAKKFESKHYHACGECHGNHAVMHPVEEMVNGVEGVCKKCHKLNDKGDTVGKEMYKMIAHVKEENEEAKRELKAAQNLGMDVEEGFGKIEAANSSFVQMRTQIHAFSTESFKSFYEEAEKSIHFAKNVAKNAVKEYWRRKYGFGIFTVFTTILIILLIIKQRNLGKIL